MLGNLNPTSNLLKNFQDCAEYKPGILIFGLLIESRGVNYAEYIWFRFPKVLLLNSTFYIN